MRTDTFSGSRNVQARRTGALRRAVLVLVAGAIGYGCAASSVQRGAEFYMQRRYIDAAQVFEHNERLLPALDAGERAEYALYRGATFLALGNEESARDWLQGAQSGMQHLSEQDRALLMDSLRAIEAERGVSPRLESASGLAATRGRLNP